MPKNALCCNSKDPSQSHAFIPYIYPTGPFSSLFGYMNPASPFFLSLLSLGEVSAKPSGRFNIKQDI